MLSRRGFILTGAAVGGGLILGYGYIALDDGDAAEKFAGQGRRGAPLNAWLKITPEGDIVVGIHRAEMGQGITTTLAMLLAEELDADWSRVRFEFTPVDRDYYNFGMLLNGQPLGDPAASWGAATGTWAIRQVFHALGMSMTISSSSTVDAWDTLRPAGAAARQMLLQAAARAWGVPVERLRCDAGFVIDPATGERLGYGALAEAASRETPPDDVSLKDPANYRFIGHNPPRLDTPMKVDGSAQFGMDVRLPGMLHAAVVHSPVAGARVHSFNAEAALALPGVQGVFAAGAPDNVRAVAVVAENSWQALQAAEKLEITAAAIDGEPVDSATLMDEYRQMLDDGDAVYFTDTLSAKNRSPESQSSENQSLENQPPENRASENRPSEIRQSAIRSSEHRAAAAAHSDPGFGDVLAEGGRLITADYSVPFLAHACMEPMNCTALYTGDALELWAPTQAQSIARDVAAKQAGLDPARVQVHMTFLGGGFGRRAEMDFIEQATAVAMALPGRPVQVFWSREQDIRHDAYRPAAACRCSGQVAEDGSLRTLDVRLVTQSVVASYETRTPTPRGGSAATDKTVVEAINPPIYPVGNLRLGFLPADKHVPAGYWRSVAHSWATFFMESFIDELAIESGRDPLKFRLALLADQPRHRAVLDTLVANLGDGVDTSKLGFAVAESHATVVAHAIEIAVTDGRFERVTRVVCAVDCGPVVHPDNVIAQMEGSIVDGLSSALYGDVQFAEGRAVQGNFDSYHRMRLHECPAIEVHLVDSPRKRPGGVGEPAVPGVAPALCNAIYAATGERVRSLPLTPSPFAA